ncbi:MAG TPA: alanine--tRNA ligase [Terriglobia bacterium]|nr:alanine--tRNA ligase [Terriglobia bacterium]
MTSDQIRSRFLEFFQSRGHRVVRSSSLVPANDPTLLFSNAGMNQFKDVFLGREKHDYVRACSSQKCVRAGGKHNDLEQVGRTARHHTFFEMLGNFSFGDYFKEQAIPWAWELITEGYGIPREKLYVTVFREDDEAADIWAKTAGVPSDRIFRMDEKDNFWAMGDTGPCGPCSEIHYDMGPAASTLQHADCPFPCPLDCGRYVELWNLVFMQFNRDEQGAMTPLPRPSIDTGAGLERLAAVLQGKLSNFETDLFKPLIEEAAALAKTEYGANVQSDVSLRIIADHARAATFLISDGLLPSNEERGYVLRKIVRRALYHGQTLGLNEPFLFKLSGKVVEMMRGAYPELLETAPHVAKAIKIEEERYRQTTQEGLRVLDESPVVTPSGLQWRFEYVRKYLPRADARVQELFFGKLPAGYSDAMLYIRARFGELRRPAGLSLTDPGSKLLLAHERSALGVASDHLPPEGLAWISGPDLFRLHDTFGLRPDFVADIVRNYGIDVDMEGYNAEMQKQRERARASWKGAEKKVALPIYQELAERHPTVFEGYSQTASDDSRILALVQDGKSVQEVGPRQKAEVVLDHTPFYAEAGGQVGDTGRLMVSGNGHELAQVLDTQRPVTGLIVHKVLALEPLTVGTMVKTQVDAERRDAIRRNHTATHLLHAALRQTLGTHVKQAGSLVAPDHLRFDFTHYAPLDEQDRLDIEDLVNRHVLQNEEVRTQVMDLDTAVNSGAMALFGEKYGDKVRVVSIDEGSFSKELCGGTHVRRTGDIGLFKLVSESSVAAGTRRIEALTGEGVLRRLREAQSTLNNLTEVLRAKPGELLQAAEKLAESEKKLRKQLEALEMKRAAASAGDLAESAREVKGVRVVCSRVETPEGSERAALRQMVDHLRARLQSGVIVLGSAANGNVALVAAVSKDLTDRLDAGKIVKAAAALVGGSGGGRKDMAEAGGKMPEKLQEALDAVPSIIAQML